MEGFFDVVINNKKSKEKVLDCETCGLYKGCISPRMQPSGIGKKEILVIAESPGCIAGDSLIEVAFRDKFIYPKGVPIKNLVGKKNFFVYSYNTKKHTLDLGKVKKVWKTGTKKIYKVTYQWHFNTHTGYILKENSIKVTDNHPFLLKKHKPHDPFKGINKTNQTYLSIKSGLKIGHSIQPFYRTSNLGYSYIGINSDKKLREGRFLLSYKIGRPLLKEEQCHHLDENKLNDTLHNLKLCTIEKHSFMHTTKNNPMKNKKAREKHKKIMLSKTYREKQSLRMKKILSDPIKYKERRQQIKKSTPKMALTMKKRYQEPLFYYNYLLGRYKSPKLKFTKNDIKNKFKKRFPNNPFPPRDNHIITSIEYIGIEDVFDMEVQKHHNFAVNDIFVHNSTEDEQGTQLVGQAGQLLRESLNMYNIDLDTDCWKTNAICCRPPDNRKPKPLELNCCRQRLFDTIKKYQPKLIIVLGSEAAKSFLGHRWKKDFPSISALRGWPIPDRGTNCWVYYTFHPSFVLRSEGVPTIKKTFQRDLGNAFKLLNKKFPNFKSEKKMVKFAKTEEEIRLCLLKVMNNPPELLAVDYETSGLKPYRKGHFIRTCAFSYRDKDTNRYCTVAFPMLKEIVPDFKARILHNQEIKLPAHHVPHERAWSQIILKAKGNWVWDSCLAAHVLDNRSKTSNLKFQSYVHFGLADYSSHMESFLESVEDKDGNSFNRIDEIELDELLLYNGIDALNTLRLTEMQKAKIPKLKRGYGYSLLHEGMLELCNVENHGMNIDLDYCKKEESKLTKEISKLEKDIAEDKTIIKWKKELGDKFKLNSNKQLGKVLYDNLKLKPKKYTNNNNPSTDKEALAAHAKDVPFIKCMQIIKLKTTARNFLRGWMREAVDNKLHSQFSLASVETFRSSSSNPCLQNVPVRDLEMQKRLRTAIIPSKGNQLLEADFKGIEVCVSVCCHKDPMMISYIKDKSKDMHRDMAMELFMLDKSQVSKEIRHLGKNGFVFPEFYGSYYEQVAPAIWDAIKERELKLTDNTPLIQHLKDNNLGNLHKFTNHVQDIENNFWNNRFKVYAKWKKDMEAEYLRKGYLETLTGFRCGGPLKRNQIANFPIQGSAFHCLLWTLIRLNKKIRKEEWRSRICSQVHDSMIIDLVPKEKDDIIQAIKAITEKQLPKHWPWIIVPMEVEMEITPINGSWYEKREMK